MRGAADAPRRIREALYSGASNLSAENGLDLGSEPRFQDIGDLELVSGERALEQIEERIAGLLAQDTRVLCLGGDHAITYPVMRAYSRSYQGIRIVQFDAHPDLYEEFEGNRYSHACPFARIMEERLALQLIQIGIRGMNPHQRWQAERLGVQVHEMRDWEAGFRIDGEGPLYLSFDMDALDPAYAPGVSHPEAGGLSTREALNLIQRMQGPVVGADIVELNPSRDPQGITAVAAAKLLKELAARMLEGDS